MSKNNKITKFFAILALLAISFSVIGTGIFFFINSKNSPSQETYSKEKIEQMIKNGEIKISDLNLNEKK